MRHKEFKRQELKISFLKCSILELADGLIDYFLNLHLKLVLKYLKNNMNIVLLQLKKNPVKNALFLTFRLLGCTPA